MSSSLNNVVPLYTNPPTIPKPTMFQEGTYDETDLEYMNKYHTYMKDINHALEKTAETEGVLNQLSKSSFITTTEYKDNMEKIQNVHKEILRLRNELDIKLAELHRTNDSIFSDSKMEFDATIYTGILWTILATSVIFYVFTKI
jgi:hypothetical protein